MSANTVESMERAFHAEMRTSDRLREENARLSARVAELEALAPDPRVAVLKILDDERTSWRKGAIFTQNNAAYQLRADAEIVALERVRTALIAAERGEV